MKGKWIKITASAQNRQKWAKSIPPSDIWIEDTLSQRWIDKTKKIQYKINLPQDNFNNQNHLRNNTCINQDVLRYLCVYSGDLIETEGWLFVKIFELNLRDDIWIGDRRWKLNGETVGGLRVDPVAKSILLFKFSTVYKSAFFLQI